MILILPKVANLGLRGVWLAGPTADFISVAITAIFFIASVRGLTKKVND